MPLLKSYSEERAETARLAAVCLLIALIGLIPAAIARAKGHSFIDRWIYGSTLFICAVLHSLLLKADAKEIESRQLFLGTRGSVRFVRKSSRRKPSSADTAGVIWCSDSKLPKPSEETTWVNLNTRHLTILTAAEKSMSGERW